jgi:2-keto-3-deoxy-L-rhamnonate aldolase RhmA
MPAKIRPDPFARRTNASGPALGTFVFSRDPAATEIVGSAGFDFAVIDTEHAPLNASHLADHVRAAESVGVVPWVRVGNYDAAEVGRLLDAGAQCIIFPHFGLNPETAAAALAATRYAPEGSRPTCTGMRGSDYGLADFAAYTREANRAVGRIGLVEDGSVVERIEEVLESCSVDAVMPGGVGDLASSLGLHGQARHPRVVEAAMRVVKAAKRKPGLKVGVYLSDIASAAQWRDEGVDFFIYSIDFKVMASAYAEVTADLNRAFL